ncbi:MAG: response regulator [Candidatus Binatia bacterium]
MAHDHPTVLLIDDNPDVRVAMREWLRLDGYRVADAWNGRDALEQLSGGLHPCVILMDLNMPVMNGFEFRQEQLRRPDISHIPIVVYSGVVDATKNAAHLKAAAYGTKPLDFQQLTGLVRQHCLK